LGRFGTVAVDGFRLAGNASVDWAAPRFPDG
jgi:hypothetical protein